MLFAVGRSVLGKTVPEALSTAVLKTSGTVFSYTDRPRTANNVFMFFSLEKYLVRNICIDFLLKQFHTVHISVKQTCVVYRSF